MKKIYQKPEMLVVAVQPQGMIAASQMGVGTPITTKTYGDAKDRGDYEPVEEPTYGDLW
ncbi:MAG: hypothetical protein IJT97_06805 [Bacteroidaceae bacterium]|nr:hypothetical protein [Bacteroidaceae bacterium]